MHKFSPTSQHHTNLKPPHSLYLSIFLFFLCLCFSIFVFLSLFLSLNLSVHAYFIKIIFETSLFWFLLLCIYFFLCYWKTWIPKAQLSWKTTTDFYADQHTKPKFWEFFRFKIENKCVIKFVIGVPNRGHTFSGNSKTALS